MVATLAAPWTGRDGHSAVLKDGMVYVLGGTADPYNCFNDVWRSDDEGVVWACLVEEAPWLARWQHASCLHEERIFVVGGWGEEGGHLNDVWASPDGTNWTCVCESAPWSERMFHALVSHNGVMYLIGGVNGKRQFQDVWASVDGAEWTLVTHHAPWPSRQGHCAVTFGDFIYLCGGVCPSGRLNDLWRSRDGASWTRFIDDPAAAISTAPHVAELYQETGGRMVILPGRQGHAAIVHKGTLLVLGGVGDDGYLNDVYALDLRNILDSQFQEPEAIGDDEDEDADAVTAASEEIAMAPTGITVFFPTIVADVVAVRERRQRFATISAHVNRVLHVVERTVTLPAANGESTSGADSNGETAQRSAQVSTQALDPSSSSSGGSSIAAAAAGSDDQAGTDAATGRTRARANSREPPSTSSASVSSTTATPAQPSVSPPRTLSNSEESNSAQGIGVQYWKLLLAQHSSEDGMDTEDADGGRAAPLPLPPRALSTQALSLSESTRCRESMERHRQELEALQHQIRLAATLGDTEKLESCLEARLQLVQASLPEASQLFDHLKWLIGLQGESEASLAATVAIVEKLRPEHVRHSDSLQHAATSTADEDKAKEYDPSDSFFSTGEGETEHKGHEPDTAEGGESPSASSDEGAVATAMSAAIWAGRWDKAVLTACEALQRVAVAQGKTDESFAALHTVFEQRVRAASRLCTWLGQATAPAVGQYAAPQTQPASNSASGDAALAPSRPSSALIRQSTSMSSLATAGTSTPVSPTPAPSSAAATAAADSPAAGPDAGTADTSAPLATSTAPAPSVPSAAATGTAFALTASQDAMKIALDLERGEKAVDELRMRVHTAMEEEALVVLKEGRHLREQADKLLTIGYHFVTALLTQVRADMMELDLMRTEVVYWRDILAELADTERLKSRRDDMARRVQEAENEVFALEDKRIDAKSDLEKRLQRRASEEVLAPLRDTLARAERSVRAARRSKRSVLAEAATLMRAHIPELLVQIPELRDSLPVTVLAQVAQSGAAAAMAAAHGSGDGSGADDNSLLARLSHGALPNRHISEYDNVRNLLDGGGLDAMGPEEKGDAEATAATASPPTSNVASAPDLVRAGPSKGGSTAGADSSSRSSSSATGAAALPTHSQSSRHIMLRATFDDDDVVLKGYILHDEQQLRGLERELHILLRLQHDGIIQPRAIVEGNPMGTSSQYTGTATVATVYLEFPFCRGGNLASHVRAQAGNNVPWELQNVARQLLCAVSFLHDHHVVHKDIKPSNVLLQDDGRVILADFDVSRDTSTDPEATDGTTTAQVGTPLFMAPEVEAGERATPASDMYSFGVLLYFMHFPDQMHGLVPGLTSFPQCDIPELRSLLQALLAVDPRERPSAANALMHPYFRLSFIERLRQAGELVQQDRKLELVRDLLNRVRRENRTSLASLSADRNPGVLVRQTLDHFTTAPLSDMKKMLKVVFAGEAGVDEGGLLTELFTIFFDAVCDPATGLFETSASADEAASASASVSTPVATSASVSMLPRASFSQGGYLPIAAASVSDLSEAQRTDLRAFGRCMVKCLYEGRRIGSRLCPSLFKYLSNGAVDLHDLELFDPQTAKGLRWMLATCGVADLDLHFEEVGEAERGPVTDRNKAEYVRLKVHRILVQSRKASLDAIQRGFREALGAIAAEAAPFMGLLSQGDWRVLMCGQEAVSGAQVVAVLEFSGFSRWSKVPQWLRECILSLSEDNIRRFLIFCTGSPSLPAAAIGNVEITVRRQPRSEALPVAHTCFGHLDVPEYKNVAVLRSKLLQAIQGACGFHHV